MLGSRLSWSFTICFFVALCSCVYICPKISQNAFIHVFRTYFRVNLFYLHILKTKANYGATTAPSMWMNEIKTKAWQKQSYVTFKLTSRSIVRFSSPQIIHWYIKGWLHCLTSDSEGSSLVKSILLPWCLAMTQIQFSLIKKIKIGRPEHSLTP